MKATELRHGNLVEYNGINWVVLSIIYPSPRDDKYSDKWLLELYNGGIITVPLDECKAIPLTSELLKRLRFIRQGNRNMWTKDKVCIELKELPNIRGEFIEGWYIGLKDLGNVLFRSFSKIKYAHTLQNLYINLQGEELTLTDRPT